MAGRHARVAYSREAEMGLGFHVPRHANRVQHHTSLPETMRRIRATTRGGN